MFADNTKLFRTVKSIDDCNILQNDLNTLSQTEKTDRQNIY